MKRSREPRQRLGVKALPAAGGNAVEKLFSFIIASKILAMLVTDGAAKRSQE
jgi:hypothetical protein